MSLYPINPQNTVHLTAFVNIWNTACGADLAINLRLTRYNTQPVTGSIQTGQFAKLDDAVVGFALASALPGDPRTSRPDIGWIDAIAVFPEFQRRGVGSELLNWAEGWLSAQGCAMARLGGSLLPFVPGHPVELGNMKFFKTRGYAERANGMIVCDVACDLRNHNLPQVLEPAGGLIRPAQPGDEDALLKFLQREFPNRWRFEFEEFLQTRGRMTDYYLLITNSGVDGFVRLTFEDSERPIERYYMHRLPRPWGQLGPIGISADQRGRGYGALLLNGALRTMKARGVRGCMIDWTDLIDFYSKFGFQPYRQYAVLSKSIASRTAPATGS